jgi:hypothetical protein
MLRLNTNEVMQIARDLMRTNSTGLGGYSCKSIGFGGNVADPNVSNKWIVRFALEVQIPDSDVFVVVEDRDGSAKLWRWSRPAE